MFYSFYIVRHNASLSVHLLLIVYLMIVDFSSLQIRCDMSLLLATLCSRTIQTREGSIVKALDCSAAAASRDALAKTVYARLFDWYLLLFFSFSTCLCLICLTILCLHGDCRLVDNVNKSVGQDLDSRIQIGVLDIYGFECFKHNRSFFGPL